MRLTSTSRRRGTVTIIVISFLLLLLLMGLTFAFYGLREAEETRVYRDSQNGGQTGVGPVHRGSSNLDQPPEPEQIFNSALGSVIYDTPDDMRGAFNVLRGQSLSRKIYGWNPVDPAGATQPYSGVGRLLPRVINPAVLGTWDNRINWAWMPDLGQLQYDPDNNWVRDPRTNTPSPLPATYRYFAPSANYTYPDLNNLYLASIDAKSGRVLIPSYHRPYIINGALPPNPPSGPTSVVFNAANDWLNSDGRMKILRPRPIDHQWPPGSGQSDFRYPEPDGLGGYADIELLPGKSIGRQVDAMWMDPDLPVGYWRGKAYKPLVAFLIVDLNGRVNLNVAGNYYGSDPTANHSSGQGLGPWEMNAEKVLPWTGPGLMPPGWNEARQIVLGQTTANLSAQHRYGENPTLGRVPLKKYTQFSNEWLLFANMPTPGSGAYHYAAVDFDGRGPVDPMAKVVKVAPAGPKYSDQSDGHATNIVWGPPYDGDPTNPNGPMGPPRPSGSSRYQNGVYMPPYLDERTNHPILFNPYLVRSNRSQTLNPPPAPRNVQNRDFGVEEVRHLNIQYNYGNYADSDLARQDPYRPGLAPYTLGKPYYATGQLNPRFATTSVSNDLDIPGSTPWRATPGNLSLTGLAPNQPTGPAPTPIDFTSPIAALGGADFDPASFRSKLTAVLGPVDIDRKLTDHRLDASQPHSSTNYAGGAQAQRAVADRQALAKDIFDRLHFVTTGTLQLPVPPAAGTADANYDGLRWLAQLAVNIVDYIDDDDYITAFNWNPSIPGQPDNPADAPADGNGNGQDTAKSRWVFGMERPRLLINEIYGRYENDPNDPTVNPGKGNGNPHASLPYVAKFWFELHNPLNPANSAELGNQSDGGAALLYNSVTSASVYKLVLTTQMAQQQLDQLDNVLGVVKNQGQAKELVTTSFTAVGPNMTHDKVAPNQLDKGGNGYTSRPQQINGAPPAFFLVASEKNLPDDTPPNSLQANRIDQNLTYSIPLFDPTNANDRDSHINELAPRILIRRLANPHEAPGPFNPYVTVDYFKMDRLMMNNALEVDKNGNIPKGKGKGKGLLNQLASVQWSQNRAYGRRQPYAACKFPEPAQANDLIPYMQRPANAADGTPLGANNGQNGEWIMQTLGRHNGTGDDWTTAYQQDPTSGWKTLDNPFQPLVHMDRVLISPIELLHVSAVRPFHFTHAFTAGCDQNAQKMITVDQVTKRQFFTANWLDDGIPQGQPGLYLWRALEFLKTSIRYEGLGVGGRVPGKVNINTSYPEVFNAVADAQAAANRFQQTGGTWSVDSAYSAIASTCRPTGQFGLDNKPLWGTATAVSPPGSEPFGASGMDQQRTVVLPASVYNGALWPSTAPGNNEEFSSGAGGQAGTLQKYEMLSKVFNNMTTRSNCFAIYAAVGYFEVRNPGPWNETNRPVLGKELGSDDGQVTRHRFFAVVDRTNLSIELPTVAGIPVRQGPAPVYLSYQSNTPLPVPGPPAQGGNNGAVTPDPIWQPVDEPTGKLMELRVPITGSEVNGGVVSLVGHYDGTVWTIRPGLSWLQIDTAGSQELVQVPAPSVSLPQPVRVDPSSPTTGIITVYVHKVHYRNSIMRLVNPDPTSVQGAITIGMNPPIPTTMPGNPGPQPGFNYKSARYAPVVRYVEQLK